MARGRVTVFGGTGFLGRHVVQHLLECEFSIRVASRHPERTEALFPDVGLGIESIHAMMIAPLPLPWRLLRAS